MKHAPFEIGLTVPIKILQCYHCSWHAWFPPCFPRSRNHHYGPGSGPRTVLNVIKQWSGNIIKSIQRRRLFINNAFVTDKHLSQNKFTSKQRDQGRIQEFVQGGAQHPLGHENPLKSIDFIGPGGGLSPKSPPLNTPRLKEMLFFDNFSLFRWLCVSKV